jgi:TonB family protein
MFGWACIFQQFVNRFGTGLAIIHSCARRPCSRRARQPLSKRKDKLHRKRIGAGLQESTGGFFETVPGRDRAATRGQSIPQFGLLETSRGERQRRWASFGLGSAVEVLVLIVFIWALTVLRSAFEEPKPTHALWSTRISLPTPAPDSATHAPQPPPRLKLSRVPEVRPKLVVPPPPLPQTVKPQTEEVPQPPKVAAAPPQPELPKPPLRKLEPQTHLGEFGSTSPATATVKLPRAEVQTGGFGSPSGLPGGAEGGSHGNVAHLGSFDQPVGPGSGNGSGGEHGARGVVASAGFGNATAQPGGGQGAGQVHSGGFTDARSLTQASPQSKAQPAAAAFEAVEITSKPNPVYTEEARQLHIQGEVVLRVVFRASGQIQILGVTQGLGHGLDEAAVRAAQAIQFKPARRNGQPTDTTATLQIVFQLAN